jgi:hypothetical protein
MITYGGAYKASGGDKMMKRTVFILVIGLVAGLSLYTIEAAAHMGGGYGPGPWGGYGGWHFPWYGHHMRPWGGYGMGFGMMWRGHGMGSWRMGPGMWGRGWGMGPGMMHRGFGPQYVPQYQHPQRPTEEKDARGILENYLQSMRNPNLKLGEIKDQGYAFEAEIKTKDGSLVDKILVDKNTGWMRSVY